MDLQKILYQDKWHTLFVLSEMKSDTGSCRSTFAAVFCRSDKISRTTRCDIIRIRWENYTSISFGAQVRYRLIPSIRQYCDVRGVSGGPQLAPAWCRETLVSRIAMRLVDVVFPICPRLKGWYFNFQSIRWLKRFYASNLQSV